jgi:DNA-binding Xre family transcriptional regulator
MEQIKQFTLYCKLESILDDNNVTAYKLAKDTGERIGTIYKLVNNKDLDNSRISGSLIAKICGYFEITPNDLFEVKEIKNT